MKRTSSAIIVAALSGALAGPPAFSQSILNSTDGGQAEVRIDIGAVWLAGNDAAPSGEFLYDIDAELAFESFTDSGRRWGFVLGGRVEQDSGRRGWGGRVGHCPAGSVDCASALVEGSGRAVRAGVSGFQSGVSESGGGVRLALQSGYGFLDIGWGEVRVGYGAGAADLDPERGPSAFRLSRADGGRVDLTGLSGARTRNLSSGNAFKLVYRSIAIGQSSSVGSLRIASSFTPRIRDCGVDHCAWQAGPAGLVSPVFDNVWEFGARYEILRGENEFAFSLGFSDGAEATGIAGFTGVRTQDAGFHWSRGPVSAGARWLRSNNGIAADGAYEAWSVSAAYEYGAWLTAFELARFSDDLVHVDGQTLQLSASRLIGERWVLGGGIQAASRDEPVATPLGRAQIELSGTAVFAELGWQF
ncbi:hypothetical protein [Maricaulis sp.]|uniref:hypothetical protein n=1 Tax=Maricaulis sp. TaxID=1486257 RepID=UPI003A8F4001